MKFELKVTEITHDELVSVFCIGYEENDFGFAYNKKDYAKIPEDKRDGDCLEDKVADCLLNGYKIAVTDYHAEGDVHNENLEHEIDDDGAVTYYVGLQNFLNGFSNPDAMECVKDLADGNDDYWTAYNLIQFVIFGETIYG